jgi:hypothetical protein
LLDRDRDLAECCIIAIGKALIGVIRGATRSERAGVARFLLAKAR